MTPTIARILEHYRKCFGPHAELLRWSKGPREDLGPEFSVAVFPPGSPARERWTYATLGMSHTPEADQTYGLELHLHAPTELPEHVELLTVIAHYHVTGSQLGWGHTVNFGRPWYPGSPCEFGLISLPYLDGPGLEWNGKAGHSTRFLWLIPITQPEREYKIRHGMDALEKRLEASQFDFLNPLRPSVV